MANAQLKAGRKWSVGSRGLESVQRQYIYQRSSISGDESEEVISLSGLPAIGTQHSQDENLYVSGYDFQEGEGGDKKILNVTVKYSKPEGSDDDTQSGNGNFVEQWGWRSGSVPRDLTHDAETGELVTNSAGDPFDSVPQVDRPCPTFTKVFKTKSRKSGYVEYSNFINEDAVTIGSFACPKHTLRCVQCDEERLFGDPLGYNYRYTIGLQYLSNLAKIEGGSEAEQIGWNIAVVDQGCRELKDGEKVRITDTDENGNQTPVSLPVLLDGEGRKSSGEKILLKFAAYPEIDFPNDFYSEPPLSQD